MKYISGICLLGMLFASCAKDIDSNPTLNTQDLTMTLLESAYPTSVVLDLSKSETVDLKIKEQPNYGFPAVTIYSVQVYLVNLFLLDHILSIFAPRALRRCSMFS